MVIPTTKQTSLIVLQHTECLYRNSQLNETARGWGSRSIGSNYVSVWLILSLPWLYASSLKNVRVCSSFFFCVSWVVDCLQIEVFPEMAQSFCSPVTCRDPNHRPLLWNTAFVFSQTPPPPHRRISQLQVGLFELILQSQIIQTDVT